MPRRFPSAPALLLFSLVLFAPAPATAQQPIEAFGEELDVDRVLLDVQVTDRRGHIVLGLEEDDFVVTEDGERVEIEDVVFYSSKRFLESTRLAEELGVDRGGVPDERYFVLFFHDQRRNLPRLGVQQMDAGRAAKAWVRELEPGDRVAVVSFDHALDVHQDFTRDGDALARAIDDAVVSKPTRRHDAETASEPAMLPHLPPAGELGDETTRIDSALETVAHAVAHIPGRKNLVLFSIGFGEPNALGFYEPDRRYYPSLRQALNDANVAVYAVDLMPTSFRLGRNELLGNSLSILSGDTGGEYFFNFVGFGAPLDRIEDENSGYYLISYRSPHGEGESGYQEVDVTVENPELRVRAREGYAYGESR